MAPADTVRVLTLTGAMLILVRMTQLAVLARKAHRSDAAALAVAHGEAWREAYAGIIPGSSLNLMIARRDKAWWTNSIAKGGRYIVLDIGGDLGGYASYGPARWTRQRNVGEISEIYLKPVYQGIGFGGRFFNDAMDELRAQRFSTCLVRALTENERALVFYERLGGRIIAKGWERIGGRQLRTVTYAWDL